MNINSTSITRRQALQTVAATALLLAPLAPLHAADTCQRKSPTSSSSWWTDFTT